jgi:hypothetical protein
MMVFDNIKEAFYLVIFSFVCVLVKAIALAVCTDGQE